jgi:hypothetical protein
MANAHDELEAPRSRWGGVPDEAENDGYTDEEVAEMVEATSLRKTASTLGWSKSKVERARNRYRKAEAAARELALAEYEAERRLRRQALQVATPTTPANADPEATDDAPIPEPGDVPTFATDTRILVPAQRTGKGSLFLQAVAHTPTGDLPDVPLTVVSLESFDTALNWARSPARERVTTIEDPNGGRGYVILPTFRARRSDEDQQDEEMRASVWRRWAADEFYKRGWLIQFGKESADDQSVRGSYEKIFNVAGAAVYCFALVGQWDSDQLRRTCRMVYWDARGAGQLPGQTRPMQQDNRTRVDSFTADGLFS